jgi:predicted ester cyclase
MRYVLLVGVAVLCSWAGAVGPLAPRVGAQVATPTAATADCPATTPEENKALVRRFMEAVYFDHGPSRVGEFLADDFNRNNPARPHRNEFGVADDAARVARTLAEFPDAQSTIEALIAEGDQVVVLLRIHATNLGPIADLGVPATGRVADWESVIIWRVACGKLAENWVVTDRLTEYRQLGIITDDELASVGTPTVATPVP